MKPSSFEMARPDRLSDVLDLLAQSADAKILAGGQSLVPLLNLRLAAPALLVDLGRVEGLSGIAVVDGDLRIGAMTRQNDLLASPLAAAAAPLVTAALPHVGHVQTRNRGTVGGSLAHADPAAELPLVVAALGGVLVAASRRGRREIAAADFFAGALTNALEADEVLVEIRIPAAPPDRRVAFREFARRHGDYAIAAAAVQLGSRDGVRELRAAIGGVGPVPHVCDTLVAAFRAGAPDRGRLADLVEQEIAALAPQGDLQAGAEYRRHLARVALAECLEKVLS